MPRVAVPTPSAAFLNVGLLINGILPKIPLPPELLRLGAALLRLATRLVEERRLNVFRPEEVLGRLGLVGRFIRRAVLLRLGFLPEALRLPAAIRLRNAAFAAPCSLAIRI